MSTKHIQDILRKIEELNDMLHRSHKDHMAFNEQLLSKLKKDSTTRQEIVLMIQKNMSQMNVRR